MIIVTSTLKRLDSLSPWERAGVRVPRDEADARGPGANPHPARGLATLSQRERGFTATFIAVVMLMVAGCSSPPSVVPLLDVAAAAIREESARLDGDLQRDLAHTASRRQVLADAYLADLRQRENPEVEWIASATEAYATAREMLVRHEHALAEERRRRRENLDLALQAQRRAIELLQRHDALLDRVTQARLLERIMP